MSRFRLLSLSFLFVPLSFSTPLAHAGSSWSSEAQTCEATFSSFKTEALPRLARCMRVWGIYRSKSSIPEAERAKAIPAFHRVYREGDQQMRYDSGTILRSMGASIPLNVGKASARYVQPNTTQNDRRSRSTTGNSVQEKDTNYVAEECSSSQLRRSNSFSKKGRANFRKKRFQKARKFYGSALDACNSNVKAIFGLSKTLAKLKKVNEANDYLQQLLDMGTEKTMNQLHGARIDDDFQNLRNSSDFKRITGYAAIHLVNSMTRTDAERDIGADEIRIIRKRLKMLRHHIVKESDNKRTDRISFPRIWFKPDSKLTAIFFKDVVDHPDTRLIPIKGDDSKYDVIIAWAQKVVMDEYNEPRPAQVARKLDPDNVDSSIRKLEFQQTNALRKPESVLNKTNRVLNTPENVGGALNRSYKRGERFIKRIPGL